MRTTYASLSKKLGLMGLVVVFVLLGTAIQSSTPVTTAQDGGGLTAYQAVHADLVAQSRIQARSAERGATLDMPYYDIEKPKSGVSAVPETEATARTIVARTAPPLANIGVNQQTTGLTFESIDLNACAPIYGFNFTPPDTEGAIGPTQFATIQNGCYRWHDKATGAPIGALDTSANGFWPASVDPSDNAGGDPRVRFDRLTDTWVISAFTRDAVNRIVFAISDGPVISGATVWTYYFVDPAAAVGGSPHDVGCFADYPMLGVDVNAILIGNNMFSCPAGFGTTAWVIGKANLPAGGGDASPVTTAFTDMYFNAPFIWSPMPVDNYDVTATESYFVGHYVGGASNPDTTLVLLTISNPGGPAGTPTLSAQNIAISDKNDGYGTGVPYPGNPTPAGGGCPGACDWGLDALGFRAIGGAHLRDGSVWLSMTSSVNGPTGDLRLWPAVGDRHSVVWWEIDAASGAVLQEGNIYDDVTLIGNDPLHIFMGSIMVSGQGHAVTGYTVNDTTALAPSAGWSGRLAGDPAGTFPNSVNVYWVGTDTGDLRQSFETTDRETRWGDYSQTSLDPCDDMTMWTIQEFQDTPAGAFGGNWAVAVAQIMAPPPPASASLVPVPATVNAGSLATINVTGSTAGGDGFYDIPATGMSASCASPMTVTILDSGLNPVTVSNIDWRTLSDPAQTTFDIDTTGATPGTATVDICNPDGQCSRTTIDILAAPGYGSTPPVGPVNVGTSLVGTPVSIPFSIFETGTAQLDVNTATITGPNAADFALTGFTFPFSIPDGDPAVDGTLTCTPSAEGVLTATLTIESNDPDDSPHTYALSCTGTVDDPGPGPGPGPGITDPALSKIGVLEPGQLGLPGEQITWIITVTNPTGQALTNIVVSDTFQPELQIDSVTTTLGSAGVNGQTVTVLIPFLSAGESATINVVTTVLSNPAAPYFENYVTMTADGGRFAEATAQVPTVGGLPDTGYPPTDD